ncbi:MAG: hypothetical protein COX70_01090, partial [Flavobacteriales bacterium CG_4_10_14_0_2_um_filter_32_8]
DVIYIVQCKYHY